MRAPFRSDTSIASLLAAASVLLYEAVGVGRPTFFDYDARLARAILDGRWWLDSAPAHLNELVACGPERLCVAYPPMPAIVAVPFVLLFDTGTAQTLASAVCGGLAAAPTYLAIRAVGIGRAASTLTTVFAAFGTTLLFTVSTGDAWFFAHAVAVLFASFAVLAALRAWPAWVIGVLLGCAALARPPVALALPALAYAVSVGRRGGLARSLGFALLGIAPFALAELVYDVLRWGSPSEVGYASLTAGNPETPYGLFDLRYLPDHLFAILLRPPELGAGPFVLRPSRWGMSMLLLSPAYVFLVPALGRLGRHVALGALVVAGTLALVPDLFHGGVGARQLGYRFSLDAQPFLLPVVATGATDATGAPSRIFVAAVVWSVLANAYATAAIMSIGYG